MRLFRTRQNFCYILYIYAFGIQGVKTFVSFKKNLLFQNKVELMVVYSGKNVKQIQKLTVYTVAFLVYTLYEEFQFSFRYSKFLKVTLWIVGIWEVSQKSSVVLSTFSKILLITV